MWVIGSEYVSMPSAALQFNAVRSMLASGMDATPVLMSEGSNSRDIARPIVLHDGGMVTVCHSSPDGLTHVPRLNLIDPLGRQLVSVNPSALTELQVEAVRAAFPEGDFFVESAVPLKLAETAATSHVDSLRAAASSSSLASAAPSIISNSGGSHPVTTYLATQVVRDVQGDLAPPSSTYETLAPTDTVEKVVAPWNCTGVDAIDHAISRGDLKVRELLDRLKNEGATHG